MNFLDISETQYCPLTYCHFINETTVNTPLQQRNVSVTEMIRQTNHTKNATELQHIWMATYGCSVNLDECLMSSDAVRFLEWKTMKTMGWASVTMLFVLLVLDFF
jgi:hypothetical protein